MPDIWTEKFVRNARNDAQRTRSIRRNNRIELPQICRKDASQVNQPENNAVEGSSFRPKEGPERELIADICGVGDQGAIPKYVDPMSNEDTTTSVTKQTRSRPTQGMAVN